MNKLTLKIVSAGLCAALCLTGAGAVYAHTNTKDGEVKPAPTTMQRSESGEKTAKDETVYVLAGADGTVEKILVSDWIRNAVNADAVSDKSDLSGIENVKGEESYTVNESGMKVWNAQGGDIYYQGSLEKELPVALTVTYRLDGKSVSADELVGKSGRVTIRFDYENRQYEMVEIDGKPEKIYVPFVMLTGMLLDSDNFRNVEVSNGKLINDGDHTAVIGFALPGLQENLALERETLELPDYVEITADVTDFQLGMTVTVATNELFRNLDTPKPDIDLSELTEGMEKLLDGSSALYDGLTALLEQSEELVNGISRLADGAKQIKDGAAALDTGAAQLRDGMTELSGGLDALAGNSAALNDGAKQVFDTLLSTANAQIGAAGLSVPTLTVENYARVLDGVIASLDETAVYNQALAQVTAAVEANRPLITEKVTAAVEEQVRGQVTAAVEAQVAAQVILQATGLSKAEYEAAVAAGQIDEATQQRITQAIAAQMATPEVQAMIQSNTAAQMQTEAVQTAIAQQVELQIQQAISENMASEAVQSQLAAASQGAKTLIALKASLDSYNSFYLGLQTYTAGVDAAAQGAATLKQGAAALKEGSEQLYTGADVLYHGALQLKNGVPALMEGVTQLKDGALQLSDGLQQLNEEGIQRIVTLLDGDLAGLLTRVEATVDVSKAYRNFSGISEDMDGQVRFLYRTDEIKQNG